MEAWPGLRDFRPDAVLFSFDAHHLSADIQCGFDSTKAKARLETVLTELTGLWDIVKTEFSAAVVQQTVLPVLPDLLGNSEARFSGSASYFIDTLNQSLHEKAEQAGIDLVSVDRASRLEGLDAWHDPGMWHRAKQDISVRAAPLYGDLVMRVLAAARGRSAKVLVLDLDNTLWGGVVGDVGVEGILLGQGTTAGEAYASLQRYVSGLEQRGVILAVCSKNHDTVARQAFMTHPDMTLKISQISSFVANWDDKPKNLCCIAEELNIGLDAVVFVDDSPGERLLVRQTLPMVSVPEIPDDPALVVRCLSRAGYFEATRLTGDDRLRSQQYGSNRARQAAAAVATDIEGYLQSLEMQLKWSYFDSVNLGRAVQLINKTNQFNLTTRRYSEVAAAAVIDDPDAIGLVTRLVDRFGDNGIVGVIIGRRRDDDLHVDTWLMSCRVLGRRVEHATLEVLTWVARSHGIRTLIGEYIPSLKNRMVRDHYLNLGFEPCSPTSTGSMLFRRSVEMPGVGIDHFINVERA